MTADTQEDAELYRIFLNVHAEETAKKAPTEAQASKKSAPVAPPASARLVNSFYDPLKKGNNLILMVKATKARIFAWQAGAWRIVETGEAQKLISHAQLEQDRRTAEAQRIWRAQEFTNRLRSMRIRKGAKAKRDELLASIEEMALRMTIKAKTVEERIAINGEKEALEEQVHEAFCGVDDEGDGDTYLEFEEPQLPEAWVIIAANPNEDQGRLKI